MKNKKSLSNFLLLILFLASFYIRSMELNTFLESTLNNANSVDTNSHLPNYHIGLLSRSTFGDNLEFAETKFNGKFTNQFFVNQVESDELKKLIQEAKQAYPGENMEQAVSKRISDITKNALIGNDEARNKLLILNTVFKKLYLDNHSRFIVNDRATSILKFLGKDLDEITNFKPTSFKQLINHNFTVESINKQANRVFASKNIREQSLAMNLIDGLLKAQDLNNNGQIHLIEKYLAVCKQTDSTINPSLVNFLSSLPQNTNLPREHIKEQVIGTTRLGYALLDGSLGQLFRSPMAQEKYFNELSKIVSHEGQSIQSSVKGFSESIPNIVTDLTFDGGLGYVSKVSSQLIKRMPGIIAKLAKTTTTINETTQHKNKLELIISESAARVSGLLNKSDGKDEIVDPNYKASQNNFTKDFNQKNISNNFIDYVKSEIPIHEKENIRQEGFIAGTKIKTLNGLKAIEDLKVGDMIAGYDPLKGLVEKPILGISKTQISEYIKILVDNEIVYAAPNQKFYLPQENKWVDAKDIKPSDVALIKQTEYSVIKNVEIIHESTTVHAITLDDHNFYISSNDILVHNMNAAIVTDKVINVIGRLILNDPYLKLFGSANQLADTNLILHQIMPPQNSQADKSVKIPTISERLQFEKMRSELYKIRTDLLKTKSDLDALIKYRQPYEKTLTAELFKTINPAEIPSRSLNISQNEEMLYNQDKKEVLRQNRQLELDQLQKQIKDIQSALAFHFNELIDSRNQAMDEFNVIANEITKIWNYSTNNDNAAYFYKKLCAQEDVLNNLENKNQELKIAIEYYEKTENATVLKKTTNIENFIKEEKKLINDNTIFLSQKKKGIESHKCIIEEYLSERVQYIYIEHLKKESHAQIKKERDSKKAYDLTDAAKRMASIKPPEDPKKDDKDKEKKIEWTPHKHKHVPQKNLSWKDIIKYTKHGDAKYKPGINIESLERSAWNKGTPTTNGKNWKVMKFDYIIGAKSGIETNCMRIEMSANTIHGHPITTIEYMGLLK